MYGSAFAPSHPLRWPVMSACIWITQSAAGANFQLGVQFACGVFRCLFAPLTQHFLTGSYEPLFPLTPDLPQWYLNDSQQRYACSCQGAAFSKLNAVWSYSDIILYILLYRLWVYSCWLQTFKDKDVSWNTNKQQKRASRCWFTLKSCSRIIVIL